MSTILTPAPSAYRIPLASSHVHAGFPSPADDYIEDKLDLTTHLVQHPNATFYVRVTGESMIGAGIHHGDLLVVDRSLDARDGDVVVAAVNGEFTVKYLSLRKGEAWLMPANSSFQPMLITEDMETIIWGVVTSSVHQYRK